MIGIDRIDKNLIVANAEELPDNGVSVAVQINDEGTVYHSGLVIGIDGEYKLFHYTGRQVEFISDFDLTEPIYCKRIEFIEDYQAINFLALCEILEQDTEPKYGLLFDGSFFQNGVYYTDSGLPFITTCVGFCLMTIKSFLINTDFIDIDDWDEESAEGFRLGYIDIYEHTIRQIEREKPELVGEITKKFVKRITPSEYASAGFYSELPISKASIDEILPNVEHVLRNKIAS